jgi:hypothetical protein
MFEKLEAYLEEISHFLSGRAEREEILSEIRSHILEKAEREFGEATESTLGKVIAAYGPARKVAEKYLVGSPIIAPAFRRYLFRYAALLFAFHFILTWAAVAVHKSFLVFPLLYLPSMGPFEALFYLPMAFLFDLGAVTLVLYLVTQSQKDVKLPWPRFSLDLDEVKVPRRTMGRILGLIAMASLTGVALYFYLRYKTIFFVNLDFARHRPIFTPEAGSWYSLILIGLWALTTISLAFKLVTTSPWVDAVEKALSLVLLGLAFRQPFDPALATPLPRVLVRVLGLSLTIILVVICLSVAAEFVKALVRIGKRRLPKEGRLTNDDGAFIKGRK